MNQPPNPPVQPQAALPGCWWHPNRPTGLSCARCGRPACPECLREAPVGFQCTDCVHSGTQQQRQQHRQYQNSGLGQRTIAGARLSKSFVVTSTLLTINVVFFLITVLQTKSIWDNGNAPLEQLGWLQPYATLGGGEWWRIFTSGFVHFGIIHIAANMFSLWMIGRALEQVFGKTRFLALYFVSVFGASTAVLLFDNPGQISGGASGAIFGLLGCYAVIVVKLKLNPTGLLVTLAINAYITFSIPGISILAHVGGLITGALVAVAILYAPERDKARWQAIGVAIIVVALLGLVVYRGAVLSSLAG
ncbi:rhomboid family intramembrane serine protease [Amycolatopsis sp. FDAARGOS 1241]|nr:rhomboid family intramembrane serine protease [Amycolatopsis sp. FDAARGOS 1241]QRP46005.1 rhomboid family intramembrane serine protease [Amycolatopsis sp. FDAARGOS 1241]